MPTVETNEIETYYERTGDGPSVVFVHGGFGDHQNWQHQVDAFSDEYEVITYDLRGHGRTEIPDGEPFTISQLADDLHALITALELENPRVCGLSVGGMAALSYASKYPHEPAALAVSGTATPHRQSRKERLFYDGIGPIAATAVDLVGAERVYRFMWWVSEHLSDEEADGTQAATDEEQENDVEVDPDAFQAVLTSTTKWPTFDFSLHAVSVPALVMFGEHEEMLKNHATVYETNLDDVRVREIPESGHNTNIEAPTAFNEQLEAFLEDS